MFEELDRRTSLTGNQKRIVAAAVLGDMLEFFDYFLIGFVLAFVVGPWGLTFGQSAIILLSSGFGAIGGAYFWGWMADRIGRRPVFNLTILNFSLATGVLAFTPDNGWIFLTIFRFVVGFGVGGLYCVDLPLVQEFMPSKKRGLIGGLVTVFIPVGVLLGRVRRPTWRLRSAGAGCSPPGCCRGCWSSWCASGCRNRRAGCPARPAGGGAQVARLGAGGDARKPAAAAAGGLRRAEHPLDRPVPLPAQPDRFLVRQ